MSIFGDFAIKSKVTAAAILDWLLEAILDLFQFEKWISEMNSAPSKMVFYMYHTTFMTILSHLRNLAMKYKMAATAILDCAI